MSDRTQAAEAETIEVTVDGARYALPAGESLQALAEHFELTIAFGCFSGRCGFCRVEVLEGAEHLGERNDLERNLLDDGDDEGRRLACQCRPTGPVRLKAVL
jgi:ferredoxin